jgi:hypothetical protein
MAAPKSLPARPSLESLRKQAKKLARDRSVSLRDAQLMLAREYGYIGWQDLTAEVSRRVGKGLEFAVIQARRAIHENDVERLKQLLAEHPALLSWHDDEDHAGLLGFATGAYGDAGTPEREQWFTRAAPAELLIDAGAVVMPSVCDGLVTSRARGLLETFQRKGLLPRTLKFFAALGDLDAVRSALEANRDDVTTVNEAFLVACSFQHEAVASILLERSIALVPELGRDIDGSVGRPGFVRYYIEKGTPDLAQAAAVGLWRSFLMARVSRALHDGDLAAFVSGLRRDPWLLGDECVGFQDALIGAATLNGRGPFISALFDLNPALLRRQPPPPSQAIEFAFTYAHTDLLPLLTRIWPVPDDLPHAAGLGDLGRVKRWFDASGAPALGDLDKHYPYNDARARGHLHWQSPRLQQVLDVALAFAVINRHFDVADFLLERGADINTNWNSHEPASILHHLVFEDNYEAMRFLIDRGIDMTIKDYRWNSTARGWALYGKNDPKMAEWLDEAAAQRNRSEQGRR